MSIFKLCTNKNQQTIVSKCGSISGKKIHSEQSKYYFGNTNNMPELIKKLNDFSDLSSKLNLKKRRFITNPTQKFKSASPKKFKFEKQDVGTHRVMAQKYYQNKKIKTKSQKKMHEIERLTIQNQINKSPKFDQKIRFKSKNQTKTKFHPYYSNKSLQRKKRQFKHLNSPIQIKNKDQKINQLSSHYKNQQLNAAYKEALKYYKQRNIQKALNIFLDILKFDQKNYQYLYYIGSCFLNKGNNELSIQYLNESLKINKKFNKNIYLYLAINYKFIKQEQKSINVLIEGLRYFPQFQDGLFYLAKLYLKNNQFKKAVNIFLKCIQLNNTNYLAKILLTDSLIGMNQTQQSLKNLKKLIHKNSIKMDQKYKKMTHLKLVQLLYKIQAYQDPDFKKSIEYLEKFDKQNQQIIFYKSFYIYTKYFNNEERISEAQISLESIINKNINDKIKFKCIKLLLRIFIDRKDLYGAQQLLNILQRNKILINNLSEWKLFVQAVNDIIKRKHQEGKSQLQIFLKSISNVKFNLQSLHEKFKIQQIQFLQFHTFQYLAYLQAISQNYQQAFKIYQKISKKENFSRLYRYPKKNYQEIYCNKLIIQGILLKQDLIKAKQCFQESLKNQFRSQSAFLWAINEISIYRRQFLQNQTNLSKSSQQHFGQIIEKINEAYLCTPKYSLLYFYHSLIQLYLKNYESALVLIKKGIQSSDQSISQFYYIQALCFHLNSKIKNNYSQSHQGLYSIEKAIQIDNSIPQFFKQKSKYLFYLGKVEQALISAQICLKDSDQQQARLLCMFYSYTLQEYQKSEIYLKALIDIIEDEESSKLIQHKYKQFQQSLMFRLRKYQNTGVLSNLLINLSSNLQQKLDQQYLNKLKQQTQNRLQYSEFSIYFINMILACYYLKFKEYDQSLYYLFSCISQIQSIIEQKSKLLDNSSSYSNLFNSNINYNMAQQKQNITNINTDLMLDQVKYNIVIVSLLKNQYQFNNRLESQSQNHQIKYKKLFEDIYNETNNFISSFIEQTQTQQILQSLLLFKKLINQVIKQQQNNNFSTKNKYYKINPYEKQYKFSDSIQFIQIHIGYNIIIKTKFIIFNPMKLKFRIQPQFDDQFLFNFDMTKVQNKLIPPWFKFSSIQQNTHKNKINYNHLLFTDHLINKQIQLSDTQIQSRCQSKNQKEFKENQLNKQSLLIHSQHNQFTSIVQNSSKQIQNIKNIMKLSSKIEKKLQKLFMKKQ